MLFSLLSIIILLSYCLYRRRQWVAQFSHIPGVTDTYFGLVGDAVLFARVINRHNYRNAAPVLQAVSGFCKSIPNNGLIKLWFGPVLMLMLTSADAVEAVLSSTSITRKGFHYSFMEPWLGSGLLTSHGNQWRRNRKMLTPTFHFKILEEFMPVMNKNGRILIQKLDQEAEKNDGVIKDLRPFILRAALDVICETAMGEEVKAQDDPDSQYIRAVYRLGQIVLSRSFNPMFFSDVIFNRTTGGREWRKALSIVRRFTDQVIARRKARMDEEMDVDPVIPQTPESMEQKRREPFLDTLIREHLTNPSQFTLLNIRDEVETFMFEGHDTTAWGVIWAVYMIGLHPGIQAKIHAEVDALYDAQKTASSGGTTSSLMQQHVSHEKDHNTDGCRDVDLTLEQLKKGLPFTEACVKEAQRLYPSVAMFTRVTESEFRIGSSSIPSGVNIAVIPSLIHRNPEYFPDPEYFRPERFLSKEKRHPFAFIPFSAGPRNCIGQKFALMEEKALLAKIFREFKVTSLDPPDRVVPSASLITKSTRCIRIRLQPRH